MLQNQKTFLFSFVRHPEKRSISAFKDFFVDKRNPTRWRHTAAIGKFWFSKQNGLTYKFDVFLDYVQASVNASALLTDRHWRFQYLNIGFEVFDYSFVGKLENLETDIKLINEMSDGVLPIPSMLAQSVQNRSSEIEFQLSVDQKRRVEKIYMGDFERFSY